MPFNRYIGIDYSGAEAANAGLKGLRVYMADRDTAPVEILPPNTAKRYWTRRGLAEWLADRLSESTATIVGIDHGFSFPLAYFQLHGLPLDWPAFLDDFQLHWPTDQDNTYVDFVREGIVGNGAARSGNSRWRRLCEVRVRRAKSVFHFDVQGSVAKSTHSGIPWLRFLRNRVGRSLHFWPFDGWEVQQGASVVAEVYPALWHHSFPMEDRNNDQHDAYSVAAWLRWADANGSLIGILNPPLATADRKTAEIEGWILGVM